MNSLSLRARVTWPALAATLVVCLAMIVTLDRTLHTSSRQMVDQMIVNAAGRLDARVAGLSPGARPEEVEAALEKFVASPEVLGVAVLDGPDGRVLARPPDLAVVATLAAWPQTGLSDDLCLVMGGAPVTARFTLLGGAWGQGRGAWLLIDRSKVEARLRRMRSLAIGLALSALAFGLGVAWVGAGFTLRPLGKLERSIARLAGGELDWRHPERGPREVVGLARQLNALAEQLEALQTELTRSLSRERARTQPEARYLEQANRALLDLANRDPLTGLANRRRLELELERHIDLARDTGQPLAVVMMDLDNFKAYNDSAGHLAGDELLRTVASTLRGRTRITDLVVRWGGDEFCILIPHTTTERALTAARSLVEAVAEATRTLPLPDSVPPPAASAGVACFPEDGEDGTELIARADAALYRAKESGRGQALHLDGD